MKIPVTTWQTSNPMVSIWMITYNHEKFVAKAVESVLNQVTTFDIELIIGNDCSTDNTETVIKGLSAKNPTVIKARYNNPNIGIGPNMVKTLEECQGKYIALLEGDDYWTDPLKLQKQVDFMEKEVSLCMVFSNREVLNQNNSFSPTIYENRIYTTADILKGFIPPTQTVMLRNSPGIVPFLRKQGKLFSGDRMLAYYCSLLGDIGFQPDFTAVYRNNGSGVWSSNTGLEAIKIQTRLFEEFHNRVGLTPNNEYCAELQFKNFVIVLTYCLKRPIIFFKNHNIKFLVQIWRNHSKMNRLKFLYYGLKEKFKKVKQ